MEKRQIPIFDTSAISQAQGNNVTYINSVRSKYLQCPTHQNFEITNICICQDCLEPLCPECIPLHIAMHNQDGTVPQISEINAKKQDCLKYIQELRELFQDEHSTLNKFFTDFQKSVLERFTFAINQAREKALQTVNQYFDNF